MAIAIDDLLCLYKNQSKYIYANDLVNKNFSKIQITKDDFIKSVDNYYLKILLLAKSILKGDTFVFV